MKRPIESDYVSQVAYTRALEAYCDEQELIIKSYLEKDNSQEDQEDLYDLAVKADNGGQP